MEVIDRFSAKLDWFKQRIFLSAILFILSIGFSVFLHHQTKQASLSYEEVEVMVVKKEKIYSASLAHPIRYNITIRYQGQEYELENVLTPSSIQEGERTTAFKTKDKFYANLEGVRSNTDHASYYFMSLGLDLILFYFLIVSIVSYNRLKKWHLDNPKEVGKD